METTFALNMLEPWEKSIVCEYFFFLYFFLNLFGLFLQHFSSLSVVEFQSMTLVNIATSCLLIVNEKAGF